VEAGAEYRHRARSGYVVRRLVSANLLYPFTPNEREGAAMESVPSLLLGAALRIGGRVLRRRLRRSQNKVIPVSEASSSDAQWLSN
jgi:hypothetical protein